MASVQPNSPPAFKVYHSIDGDPNKDMVAIPSYKHRFPLKVILDAYNQMDMAYGTFCEVFQDEGQMARTVFTSIDTDGGFEVLDGIMNLPGAKEFTSPERRKDVASRYPNLHSRYDDGLMGFRLEWEGAKYAMPKEPVDPQAMDVDSIPNIGGNTYPAAYRLSASALSQPTTNPTSPKIVPPESASISSPSMDSVRRLKDRQAAKEEQAAKEKEAMASMSPAMRAVHRLKGTSPKLPSGQ